MQDALQIATFIEFDMTTPELFDDLLRRMTVNVREPRPADIDDPIFPRQNQGTAPRNIYGAKLCIYAKDDCHGKRWSFASPPSAETAMHL